MVSCSCVNTCRQFAQTAISKLRKWRDISDPTGLTEQDSQMAITWYDSSLLFLFLKPNPVSFATVGLMQVQKKKFKLFLEELI